MPKKIVSTKMDIPKWYTKRIKNFEILREKEALFEYESLKIQERARKQAKKLNIKYDKPKIVRPSTVIASDIQALKDIELESIKEAVQANKPIVPYTSPIYAAERVEWKRENLPDYHYKSDYDFKDYDFTDSGDIEDDYLSESDIREIESSFPTPEPTMPTYVDPTTAEAIFEEDIPDYLERVKEFIDDIIDEAYNQGDQAVVSFSTYRSGRTKSRTSIAWAEQNINRAVNKVVSKLTEIRNTDSLLRAFAEKCNDSSYLSSLQNAIGAYIAEAYSDTTGQSFYISRAYELLSFTPTTLDDAMDFEYEE